jgi:hypothetical protein
MSMHSRQVHAQCRFFFSTLFSRKLTYDGHHQDVDVRRCYRGYPVQVVDEAVGVGDEVLGAHLDVHAHHRLAEDFLRERRELAFRAGVSRQKSRTSGSSANGRATTMFRRDLSPSSGDVSAVCCVVGFDGSGMPSSAPKRRR